MALATFAVCERVRLTMGAVSIILCTLVGARSMEGKHEHVRRAIGYSGLAVGICGIGISVGVGMTTLGGNAGGAFFSGTAHRSQDRARSGASV